MSCKQATLYWSQQKFIYLQKNWSKVWSYCWNILIFLATHCIQLKCTNNFHWWNLLKNYLFTQHLHFTYYDLKSDAASCLPQAKWSCKGVKLFQICSYSEDAECGYGTLAMDCLVWFSSWLTGRSGGRPNLNLLQYLTPASLWENGLTGFTRRSLFSLRPLHQLFTKPASLKMKPVLLSSHDRTW